MGSNITALLKTKETKLEDLKNKTLAVDAFNTLYMFLTTIRGPDGTPLSDSKGNMTSHLIGILSRFINYKEQGIDFIFVFDGKPPELKSTERERRKTLKVKAREAFDEAKKQNDVQNMKKYAARATFLNKEMIDDAKELLTLMGIKIYQSPSEGEAQAAQFVKEGKAYAVLSQDADALLAGAPRVIKNLSISGKRKKPKSYSYETVYPEIIHLKENLDNLNITQDKLIALAMLVGTDYNYGGIKGIGPKKALKLITQNNIADAFDKAKFDDKSETSWKEIYEVIKSIKIDKNVVPKKQKFNPAEFKKFLENREFSEKRIENYSSRLKKLNEQGKQEGLNSFF